MHKRFLAMLAMIATIFAFGVGAALAEQPDHAGPPDGAPRACEKDNPPDWCDDDDGQPGNGGDHGDGDDGNSGQEGSPLDQLCDALGAIDPAVADACHQIVDVLAGGEAPTFPPEEFPPGDGGGFDCAQLGQVPEIGVPLADGCRALSEGETPEFPPGDGGEGFDCAQLEQIPEIGVQLADGCRSLSEGGAPTFPPEELPLPVSLLGL